MKKNVKQKAGFRWKCVLKTMFILLFTRINNEQSSIVSKISIYLATHVTIYVNYLRRQRSVRAISLHCLTPACWCHGAGMSATSASIAAPSSAGSRRCHEASPTPSRGSPPRCVRPCRSFLIIYFQVLVRSNE